MKSWNDSSLYVHRLSQESIARCCSVEHFDSQTLIALWRPQQGPPRASHMLFPGMRSHPLSVYLSSNRTSFLKPRSVAHSFIDTPLIPSEELITSSLYSWNHMECLLWYMPRSFRINSFHACISQWTEATLFTVIAMFATSHAVTGVWSVPRRRFFDWMVLTLNLYNYRVRFPSIDFSLCWPQC